ncbi:MAG TPA: hypothetical protein VJ875_16830 [Pyrinomonadaceae bacterium]|nr:hypothetical protein [Pyrinomonadaceae bacterium]
MRENIIKKVELLMVVIALFAGTAFLTKMCYLSLAFNTIFAIAFLALFLCGDGRVQFVGCLRDYRIVG